MEGHSEIFQLLQQRRSLLGESEKEQDVTFIFFLRLQGALLRNIVHG